MKNQKLHILPISNINDVSNTIHQLKNLLRDTEHEIHLLTNSIAIYITKNDYESDSKLELSNINKVTVGQTNTDSVNNNITIEDNIEYDTNYLDSSNYKEKIRVDEMSYMQFMHNIKIIQRTSKIYL